MSEGGLTGSKAIMNAAESAKQALIVNRSSGERQFQKLLAHHPGDGMVYLKRGEAYEVIG